MVLKPVDGADVSVHDLPQPRICETVQTAVGHDPEPPAQLVAAAGAGVEMADPVRDGPFDRPVIARIEVQEFNVRPSPQYRP